MLCTSLVKTEIFYRIQCAQYSLCYSSEEEKEERKHLGLEGVLQPLYRAL